MPNMDIESIEVRPARGVWKLNLMVRRGNEGAMGFYAELGYGEDEVVAMSKRLRETPTAVG